MFEIEVIQLDDYIIRRGSVIEKNEKTLPIYSLSDFIGHHRFHRKQSF